MNNLFNIKLLKRKLDNFNITEEKLKNSSEIISNWASLLISCELDKQNEKMLQGDFLKDFFQINYYLCESDVRVLTYLEA